MPFVEHHQRLYPLLDGENRVGSGAGCEVRIPELSTGEQLTIAVKDVGAFVWVQGPECQAQVNGRPLRSDPVPIFHGDQLMLNGATLIFLDEQKKRGGSSASSEDPQAAPGDAPKRPPAAAGPAKQPEPAPRPAPEAGAPQRQAPRTVGVLRRLDTGDMYVIDRAGFRIGREKRCDVIIPDRSVSRLHAEIAFDRGRYLLRDLGRHGTRVNGERIDGPHALQLGDVLEVGDYEFAFARKPAEIALEKAREVTPIRGSVPDAPTVDLPDKPGGGRALFWVLFLVVAGLAAAAILIG